ncbi:MAG TPA: hypothetical protein VFA84_01620 [Acidimicrobiales bacterium]|nr:hypothetical protein [Acidimicrobiales bacterium]
MAEAKRTGGFVGWARDHVAAAAGLTVAAVVAVVVVIIVIVSAASGGSGTPTVAPGSIVEHGPLSSGYRITGTLKAKTAAAATVTITSVDFAAPEARNVVLFAGQVITFEQPTQGVVAVARNGHRVNGVAQLHTNDTLTLVGQFTTVGAPPGHQGYAFFGIEARTK